MSTEYKNENAGTAEITEDRRSQPRFAARAQATIFRETDFLRNGIAGNLHDLSTSGLGINLPEGPPELGEQVKIVLANEIQRFSREVRGIVRHVTGLPDGSYRIGVELTARLTPLEVSLLKINTFGAENKSSWV